jgi:hypothetical protein
MSLLDTASLLLTPNAYKEGKLYSVIPSDGSGDFTFTRATTATRVNSAGLVELVPYNLVSYSEQFNNAYWQKLNGGIGSIPTVTANTATSPDGTLTADRIQLSLNGGTSGSDISYINANVSTTAATFSIYAKSNTTPCTIYFRSGSTVTTINITTEWQRFEIYSSGAITVAQFGLRGGSEGGAVNSNTADISVWGAQLNEGSTALPYQKTETRLNIPRLDYSLGGCPNILLEPQRTNLTTYSEQFDDASWNKINSSVTANADISPDGYTNADRIYDNATSGQHRVGKNISVVSATTYTFSVFAKKGSLRYCYLFTVAGGASDRYYFDLQDGVSITAGGKIEDYGSGWYRISAQVTAAATGNELFAFNLTNSSSSPTYSGTGTGYHMIYGYQVEAGDYATSYIPTTTASVTRNKDTTVEKDLTSFGIGNSYTLLFDLTMATEDSNKILFYLKNSAGADSFTFRNFSGILSVYDAIGLTYPLAALANESTKWAFRFDGVNYSLFRVSGGVAVKNTATLGTARNIGYLNSFNISGTKASLKLLAIEPSALTDVECEQFVIS